MKKLIIESSYGLSLFIIGILSMLVFYPELKSMNNLSAQLLIIFIPILLIVISLYLLFLNRESILAYKTKQIFDNLNK